MKHLRPTGIARGRGKGTGAASALALSLVLALTAGAGSADQAGPPRILSPQDGDILSSPATLTLQIPQAGTYHLTLNHMPLDRTPLPAGHTSRTLDLPTGLHQLGLQAAGHVTPVAEITILVEPAQAGADSCLTCGGSTAADPAAPRSQDGW
ncbi:hypothetical protein [Phaeobacter italicus]|uniref:hypothetical protein n=1 Tax=Phaeobacter italicus TaxID=481446 RepID=UPI000669F85C|nr:hypothetical protein [Phaeobacter italicus]CRL15175.1 hypothetical protein NIT7645_02221 [Phaeobacter italicus]SFG98944.1 hypothetical protein SAMN04488019_105219 [Phaeobacter italicus]